MNSKHLTKGDPCPPPQEGKMRIYSMRFCPYAQRALLIAAAKKIPYEVVNVNLTVKPEWIFEKNPGGKVPTIETPKGPLYESLIVCDYMDELANAAAGDQSRLNPCDPYLKALDRIWVENFTKVSTLDYKAFYPAEGTSEDTIKTLIAEMYEAMIPFENELNRRGTKFFGGNSRPGMLDYMIWPWVERLPTHELLYKEAFDFTRAKDLLKTFTKWSEDMTKDPGVLESYCTPEVHLKYRMSRKAGNVEYDILLGK